MSQRDSGTYIQLGCGFYVLAALFLCSVVAVFGKIQADHFWDDGVRVEGTIITIDTETVRHRSRSRIASEKVLFSYLVDGQTFRSRQHFPYDTSFYLGQIVPVIYLPNTPWDAKILADEPINLFVVVILGVCIILGSDALLTRVRQSRSKHKEKPLS